MKKIYFLGIYHGHNATVALIDSTGSVVECVSEERFTGKKNYTGFPFKSIQYIKRKYPKVEFAGVGVHH